MNSTELTRIKQKIDRAASQISEYTGELKALQSQLKSEFGCVSVADADEKLRVLKAEVVSLERKIEKLVTELKQKYNDVDGD